MQGGILIIDYGSQYTQLIARRIREFNVYCEIHPYNKINHKILKSHKPNGLILSGGPNSTLDKGSPQIPKYIKFISKPILGICYGLQLLTNDSGGKIKKSLSREYGYAKLKILRSSEILPKEWINKSPNVWMSHGDSVSYVPKNFQIIAKSNNNIISIIESKKENFLVCNFIQKCIIQNMVKILLETLYLKFVKLNIIGSLKILLIGRQKK